jgi:hypothetical protein
MLLFINNLNSKLEYECLQRHIPYTKWLKVSERINQLLPIEMNTYQKGNTIFYKYSLTNYLQNLLADETQKEKFKYGWMNYQESKTNGIISDFWSGLFFKELINNNPEKYKQDDVYLLLCGDGLQLFRERTHETGFLEIQFLNYNPIIRSKKGQTFTYGIIAGPRQPSDMHSVLKPFVEELSLLSTKGFKTTDNKHRRAHCIIVAGDLKYLEKMDEKLAVGTYRVCR